MSEAEAQPKTTNAKRKKRASSKKDLGNLKVVVAKKKSAVTSDTRNWARATLFGKRVKRSPLPAKKRFSEDNSKTRKSKDKKINNK